MSKMKKMIIHEKLLRLRAVFASKTAVQAIRNASMTMVNLRFQLVLAKAIRVILPLSTRDFCQVQGVVKIPNYHFIKNLQLKSILSVKNVSLSLALNQIDSFCRKYEMQSLFPHLSRLRQARIQASTKRQTSIKMCSKCNLSKYQTKNLQATAATRFTAKHNER